jgi:acyl transferase domain-containing protein
MSAPAADSHRGLLDRAVHQLRVARARLEAVESERHEPLAVIGGGVRLPGGVEDLDGFWRLLRDGTDVVCAQQMSPDGRRAPVAPPAPDGPCAAQLADVESCDAEFFGLGELEARHMDPQQRLVLEVAWEAIEDAGLPIEQLPPDTGVFLGIYGTDYLTLQHHDPAAINAYTGPGGALSIAANRLSYLLDLHGPSMAVDTACSSSLVAVHLACRALRAGDCDLALVGGVNVMVSALSTRIVEQVLPLSPTGRCRSFDAGADGIVRGEGCAMLVLRRASVARAAGGRIRGLVRGTAVNQDGRSNGLTAPSPRAQSALHRSALADAAVDPADVVYVEAHGTGTPLGDPIEARALGEVYGPGSVPCAMGSVKANLGHLEAAAGIVGLVKAMLVLEHGHAPPHLHLQRLNPEIDLAGTRLHLPTELAPLPDTGRPALATVSSFGFGGTNAHAILEAAPATVDAGGTAADADDGLLLAISARGPAALAALAGRYAERLEGCDAPEAADVCAAAALRRTHHALRLAIAADDRDELVAGLRTVASTTPRRRPGAPPRIAFVFSGQGCQWTGMGRELLEREAVVREEVAACDAIVRDLAGWSVSEQLSASDGESRLHETEVAQVAIGTLQLALAALWRARGVEPEAVAGHSMGEIVAACVAGALDRAQALQLLVRRGRISERAAKGGAMASIGLAVAEVEPLLAAGGGGVAIAAVNGPHSTVVSGDPASVELVTKAAAAVGARSRRLLVEYGFHSPLLDGCDGELAAGLGDLRPRGATLALYSTVTGGRVDPQRLVAAHWGRNLRDAVLLAPAIDAMASDGVSVFIEVGPHPVLLRDVAETLEAHAGPTTTVGSMRRDRPARSTLATSLAGVYESGATVRWDAVLAPPRAHVALPAYPWQRRRHWLPEPTTSAIAHAAAADASAPLARVLRIAPAPAASEPFPERSRDGVVDHTMYVRERVCAAAGLDIEEVPPDIVLETLELSSLSIVELRNQVEREIGVVVPLAVLLGGGTPVDLARAIAEAVAATDAQRHAGARRGRA